ncbi:potassium channel subfamily K member 10 [Lingula anatina]|uniref:Potassium channel subfamily K member 10 n=1 Tax=Lingula anatina TaxID=7574 RepID=A0A1S3KF64_LINAN|nr:potassium channel subfamily K member 10 [Lingula anatina]XP_013421281.1 potassium channel subfamily K member 10 [Lingula anatina]XP_023931627.1 potassium channel subfamily K member 10 [Lingula anatina]|eukprot:XP_013421280.1 potassium channel subfamily K member 10 [Lingula anatina]
MKGWVLALLLFVCLIYVIIGGVVFHFIETPNEDTVRTTAFTGYQNFLKNFTCVSQEELETLIKTIIKAYDSGVLQTNSTQSASNWDIPSAVFFSATIITTIGYGNISPTTAGGRAFCVIYAIFGIPMMGVILATIGQKIKNGAQKLRNRCFPGKESRKIWIIKSLLTLALGIILFMIVPAGIFTAIEGWTYAESLYYTFITLTTIGFGDFVAGVESDPAFRGVYRLAVTGWIVLGLAWAAVIVSNLTDDVEETANKVELKLQKGKENKAAEGEDEETTENGKDSKGNP